MNSLSRGSRPRSPRLPRRWRVNSEQRRCKNQSSVASGPRNACRGKGLRYLHLKRPLFRLGAPRLASKISRRLSIRKVTPLDVPWTALPYITVAPLRSNLESKSTGRARSFPENSVKWRCRHTCPHLPLPLPLCACLWMKALYEKLFSSYIMLARYQDY